MICVRGTVVGATHEGPRRMVGAFVVCECQKEPSEDYRPTFTAFFTTGSLSSSSVR